MNKISHSTKSKFILLTIIIMTIFAFHIFYYFYVSKTVFSKANLLYQEKKYDESLEVLNHAEKLYKDSNLYFNIGQIYYSLKKYKTSLEYIKDLDSSVQKYILMGNIYVNTANELEEGEAKRNLLYKALESLKNGIIEYPEDVTLKYNYEYVEKLIKDPYNNDEKNDEEKNDEENDEQNQQKNESQNQNPNQSEGNQPNSGAGNEATNENGYQSNEIPDLLDLLEETEEAAFKENQNQKIEGQVTENDW